VKVLKEIEGLLKLDLSGNDVCKLDDYRDSIFKAVPQLECLDGKDKDDQSVETEDDEDDYG